MIRSAALAVNPPKRRGTGASRAMMSATRAPMSVQWGEGLGTAPQPPDTRRLRSSAFSPLPGTTPVSLLDHRAGEQCRWPVGEGPTLFCGCPLDAGSRNYCTQHLELSQPSAASPATVPVHRLRDLERMAR